MAFTVLHQIDKPATGASGITSDAIDTTGADLIVLAVGSYFTSPGVSDSKGNTWTPLTIHTDSEGVQVHRMWYCVNPTVGTGHTFTSTGQYAGISAVVMSGSAASPFDQESGAAATSGTSIAPGSLTPSANDAIVIVGLDFGDGNTLTGGTGFTTISNNFTSAQNIASAIGYQIQTTATAVNPTYSWTGGGVLPNHAISMAVFKSLVSSPSSSPSPSPSPSISSSPSPSPSPSISTSPSPSISSSPSPSISSSPSPSPSVSSSPSPSPSEGSFTCDLLTATGDIDGVNRTYSFASAPDVVIVDDQVLQKTSKDGTVNWTGTTSITLTVAPTMSIVGYSSSTYESPSDTVDGVNKTFTFSVEPDTIIVDNISFPKVSADSTVNWTGTTTVTLTVAPTFDIFIYCITSTSSPSPSPSPSISSSPSPSISTSPSPSISASPSPSPSPSISSSPSPSISSSPSPSPSPSISSSPSPSPSSGSPVTITVDDADLFFSPYNWRKSGSSYAESNAPGAYIKTKFSGTSVKLNVDVSMLSGAGVSAGNYPAIEYSVDGGSFTRHQLTSSDTQITLFSGLSDTVHTLEVHFVAVAWNTNDRWSTPVMVVRVTGLELDPGEDVSTPTLRNKRMIAYGDSHAEGHEITSSGVSVANQNARLTFTPMFANLLDAEYGLIAYAGQGYIATGGGSIPNCQDAWDFYSSGQSRLSGGSFSPAPDYIFIHHGTNDSGQSAANVTAAAEALIDAWRAAATNARIFICKSPTNDHNSSLVTAVTNAADPLVYSITSSNTYSLNGSHLSTTGHVEYFEDLDSQVETAAESSPSASPSPSISSSPSPSPSPSISSSPSPSPSPSISSSPSPSPSPSISSSPSPSISSSPSPSPSPSISSSPSPSPSVSSSPSPEPEGRLKYWNGTEWQIKPLKYWNGSSWEEKILKYWDGDSWEN